MKNRKIATWVGVALLLAIMEGCGDSPAPEREQFFTEQEKPDDAGGKFF